MKTKVLTILSLSLFCLASRGLAEEIDVPDLETKIRNTGNAVPEKALPKLKDPEPAALPAVETPPAVPVTVPAPVVVTPVQSEVVAPQALSETELSGFLEMGAGNPGTLWGQLSLVRISGDSGGLAIDFIHATADGYGPAKTGEGFFDRRTELSMRLFDDQEQPDSFASLLLSDRSDGFQGLSAAYGLTHREISGHAGLLHRRIGSGGVYGSFELSLSVVSGFADMGSSNPSPFDAYNAYYLSPWAAIGWASGDVRVELFGQYGYDTAADFGELQLGRSGLDIEWQPGRLRLEAVVSGLIDSTDGLLAPFSLTLATDESIWLLSSASLSGGLDGRRVTPWALSTFEPFAALTDVPVLGVDWFGIFAASASPTDTLKVQISAEYRKTAFDRGILVLDDAINLVDSRIGVLRQNRDSLVVTGGVDWSGKGTGLTVLYSGEWLDRLGRTSVQTLETKARVFDPAANRVWEAGVSSVFSLDSAELPIVGFWGTARPVSRVSVTLALKDVLPLAANEARSRNEMYEMRSGELSLSARIDF